MIVEPVTSTALFLSAITALSGAIVTLFIYFSKSQSFITKKIEDIMKENTNKYESLARDVTEVVKQNTVAIKMSERTSDQQVQACVNQTTAFNQLTKTLEIWNNKK